MENSLFGIIIKVKNMDICRSFYRDVLDLGEPEINSNFWVEFHSPTGYTVALEKSAARFLKHESAATAWVYRVSNVEETRQRLEKHGFKASFARTLKMGEALYQCHDPENNVFYIFQNTSNQPETNKI